MASDSSWASGPLRDHYQLLCDLLAQEKAQARSLVDEAHREIRQMNCSEGPNVYLRLVLRERGAFPELLWFRTLKTEIIGPDGKSIRLTVYLGGLRDCRYRSEAFSRVAFQHRASILLLEDKCVVIRRRVRAIKEAMRYAIKLGKELDMPYESAVPTAQPSLEKPQAGQASRPTAWVARAANLILEDER